MCIKVLHLKSSYHIGWVFCFMWWYKENPWHHWQALEISIIKSFLEPNKLCYECHVWVDTSSFRLHHVISLFVRNFFGENFESQNDCCWSADPLDTMHVDFAAIVPGCLNELYSVVEHTRDIFAHMVFQKVTFVLYSFLLQVVFTVISWAVYNVGDA